MEHQNEDTLLIEELRKRFLSRGPELEEFDKRDIERVHQDDIYVEFFFNHKHGDMEKALELMVDCLKWRSQFGINDIMERNIDRRLFELGFLYPRNKDKHGNPLLFFHMKKYKKELFDMKEVKKLFAFALEKLSLQFPGKQITMVFDMQDSGISNMDMDLIKFVITCFQLYFPNILEYLIVYETPWILTAAWKIVKGWMSSDGISKIKTLYKFIVMLHLLYISGKNRKTKYLCVDCSLPVCNICSIEVAEDDFSYSEAHENVGCFVECSTQTVMTVAVIKPIEAPKKLQNTIFALFRGVSVSQKIYSNQEKLPSSSQSSRNVSAATVEKWKSELAVLTSEWLEYFIDLNGKIKSLTCKFCRIFENTIKCTDKQD